MATPSLREELRARALRLGFADLRIAPAEIAPARSLAYRRFVEKIKDAVDPQGILSPGRHGIWPASMRGER